MRRHVALLTVAVTLLTPACSSDSTDSLPDRPQFVPTALSEDEIGTTPPSDDADSLDSSPATLDALIDLAYGAVVVDVADPEPTPVPTDNGTTMNYYRVRVVENVFGGYKPGTFIDVIMGYVDKDPKSPFNFEPRFGKGERLLLFTQHSVFGAMGFDYPEAEEIVGARDGLFRFVGVGTSDATQRVAPHGYLEPTTLDRVVRQSIERVTAQGVDPEERNEMRSPFADAKPG